VDIADVFSAGTDILGRKWHLRIVYYLLEEGAMGFSDLKETLDGVSSKMLSESLSTLEDEQIIRRDVVSDQPLRVEYTLTERGAGLEPVVAALIRWQAEFADTRGETA
jgi:DNA-binding HxlR family transcriptional regulator